ncbi:MAG: VIT domain-containing protein [Pirellulales bacterium]
MRHGRDSAAQVLGLPWRLATAAIATCLTLAAAQLFAQANGSPAERSDTLTADGRIGKVVDVQGTVTLRPLAQRRWSPVCEPILLRAGDWLRTDLRGANAVAVKLVSGAKLTLGPGSLVELTSGEKIQVTGGTVQIEPADNAPLEVVGPGGESQKIAEKRILRTDDRKLVTLDEAPQWLQSFEGTVADESIGSLVAQVDGRDVPLTVGYHKVAVDIRDQIARTVIEESFVNHTPGRLEGVFYFPLPQDASISGFGMWIGDELVEADIVEKQRAREIYETILREKRDPGLLEWSGGNIFKARVFPIEPHSEKRIRISYTQVLPRKGQHYRYSYALQSELLKQHPLRELTIDVTVQSALPLARVRCATHPARVQKTSNSARIEFAEQEYTPTRDFEVEIEAAAGGSDVLVIPHQRGDDGYFMLMLTPPGSDGQWQRELVADGEPLEMLILADTSASMGPSQRETQAALLAALLGSLSPEDRFNVAGCDVDCHFVFDQWQDASEDNKGAARKFIDSRTSLGWTDLDKSIAAALKRATPKTHVIYLGDGVVTTGQADPTDAAKRLRYLHQDAESQATFHAISMGSSFESTVLAAIASLGGGSVRHVDASRGPEATALELLSELTQPGLTDLQIEFHGVRTARVYPERIPNLASGMQQILLGRYLPEGAEQHGEVVVTGRRGGKEVRFTAPVTLAEAEKGNSFIPRLWARMHLDSLLAQGSAEAIQEEIIALSEEFHIMTPYTSLLVLESDEDRERFKVKRRFQMRDGERFFAEGRSQAETELLQQAMRQAGSWRIGLRQNLLLQLAMMGREVPIQPWEIERLQGLRLGREMAGARMGGFGRGGRGGYAGDAERSSLTLSDFSPRSSAMPMGEFDMDLGVDGLAQSFGGGIRNDAFKRLEDRLSVSGLDPYGDLDKNLAMNGPMPADEMSLQLWDGASLGLPMQFGANGQQSAFGDMYSRMGGAARGVMAGARVSLSRRNQAAALGEVVEVGFLMPNRPASLRPQPLPQPDWLQKLFPYLPPAIEHVPDLQPSEWPEDIRELSESLLRRESLLNLEGGIRMERLSQGFDPRYEELVTRSERLDLYSPRGWVTRDSSGGGQTVVNWCDQRLRGVLSVAYLLGRHRDAVEQDRIEPSLMLSDYSLNALHEGYRNYVPKLDTGDDDGRVVLTLTQSDLPERQMRITIDTERDVVLSVENLQSGTVNSRTTFEDFVEVAGTWWAQRVETTDEEGRRLRLITYEIEQLPRERFEDQIEDELAIRNRVQEIHEPLPTVEAAKQAIADNKATFEDRLVMMLHFADSQQWEPVIEHLEAAEQLAAGKAGVRWLRNEVLWSARQHAALQERILAEAAELAESPEEARRSEELFLANQLISTASTIFEHNEMLTLLDRLMPIYDRQSEYLKASKQWRERQVTHVQGAGRVEEALALWHSLAADYSRDAGLQRQYAERLVSLDDFEAAYAWLERAVAGNDKWNESELGTLRGYYADLLRSEGRYADLVEYLTDWAGGDPESQSVYEQLLSALVYNDQLDRAYELADDWLSPEQQAGEFESPVAARLNAAISFALGEGYNLRSRRIEERWLEPLREAAIRFARHDEQLSYAGRILDHYRFNQTDACREARAVLAERLLAEGESLSVAKLTSYVAWVLPDDPGLGEEKWTRIAEILKQRWNGAEDDQHWHQISEALVGVLTRHATVEELLAFLRLRLEEGPDDYRAAYAQSLFNTLLAQRWTAEYETESLKLIEQLSTADSAAQRLVEQVQGLYRWTDAMAKGRFDVAMDTVEKKEDLTRTELQEKQRENLKAARSQLAERLREAARDADENLRPWLVIERIYLEVLAGGDRTMLADECWEFLGDRPPVAEVIQPQEDVDAAAAAEQELADFLRAVLRYRYLRTVAFLSVREPDEPLAAVADRLLGYLDQAIAAQNQSAGEPANDGWKQQKFQLLVALDRVEALREVLARWVEEAGADQSWRLALGRLVAELGEIEAAITHFETVQAVDELQPIDYRMLADWYLVADRADARRRAMIRMYQTMEEWQLRNYLSQQLRPWQVSDGNLPSELDEQVLLVFAALLEKSSNPENFLGELREFYRATHDFRLMTGMADAVLGHTPGKIYPYLGGIRGVLEHVREEATIDSIVEHVDTLRESVDSETDLRALDLLTVLAERRAAELINQPGPHTQAALTALRRAFERAWAPGEEVLMADFLANLGNIAARPLAEEQMRQLAVLHDRQTPGELQRLQIAHSLARARWNYDQRDGAVQLLESAIGEFAAALDGVLPTTGNDAFSTFVQYLQQLGHFARAERFIQQQLAQPAHQEQELWLTERLYETYLAALRAGGEVSLGRGQTLFARFEQILRDALSTRHQNHRYQLIEKLCETYRVAHELKLEGVVARLKDFASEPLTEVLRRQTNYYENIVSSVAQTLHDIASPREGLAQLVLRIEQEPAWFRLNNRDGWSQHSHMLARWREEAQPRGGLEERLLAIVLEELRRDLQSQEHRNRTIYHQHYGYFWTEKAGKFAEVANEVWRERRESAASVAYIAEYLYQGLDRHNRAIEILMIAYDQERLTESQTSRLVEYLQWQKRFEDSIPILLPLVEKSPGNIQYRVWLMHAYFRTGQEEKLLALLDQTDEYFHQENRWQEHALAALAASCLENELYARSAAYYEELIPLHQRTQPNRGIGNSTLSSYYANQARAYAGLGDTAKAVEAASGAIVSWGPHIENRRNAIGSLKQVLRESKDLDAYVAQLNLQTAETGMENPIVRKALGMVYLDNKMYEQAIVQLETAEALQPNDEEVHDSLIAAYDAQGDKEGAIAQLIQAVQFNPRDIARYRELGKRFAEQPEQQQRAFTSIIEALPLESESHTMLAEVRESQNRWSEAIDHWQRVAEIRALEPTGLLRLAQAQIHAENWAAAQQTVDQLQSKAWPDRFSEVQNQIRELRQKVEKHHSS